MAGPTVIGGTPNQGMESLKAGIEQVAQLGKFLEQKRQFEEDQNRLDRIQKSNNVWTMIQELQKSMDAKSIKDVAQTNPKLLSMFFELGMGIDQATAMPMITAWAQSPYNAEELANHIHTMTGRYGSSTDDPKTIVQDSISEVQKATTAMAPPEEGTTKAASQTPAPTSAATPVVTKVEMPTAATPELPLIDQYKNEVRAILSNNGKSAYLPYPRAMDLSRSDKYKNDPAVQAFAKNDLRRYIPIVPGRASIESLGPVSIAATKAFPSQGAGIAPEAAPTPEVTKAGRDYLTRPVTSKPPYLEQPQTRPAAAPPEQIDEMDKALNEYIKTLMENQGKGQTVLKGKRYEKAMSPVIAAQLAQNPEGVKTLVSDAEAFLSDPGIVRSLAIQQSPASVYAAEGKQEGPGAFLDLQAKILDLGIKKMTLKTAMLNFAKAGVDGQMDQIKLVREVLVNALISSGTFVPSELAGQYERAFDAYQKADVERQTAKAAGKEAEMIAANNKFNTARQIYLNMQLSLATAVGKSSKDPQVQAASKLLGSVSKYEQGNWLFFKAPWPAWGQFVETNAEAARTGPVVVPPAEDAVRKKYNTTGQKQ